MNKRDAIVETFDRIEAENGGLAKILPSRTIDLVAEEMRIDRKEVHRVMLDHWTMAGSG